VALTAEGEWGQSAARSQLVLIGEGLDIVALEEELRQSEKQECISGACGDEENGGLLEKKRKRHELEVLMETLIYMYIIYMYYIYIIHTYIHTHTHTHM
jgi:hypothetical protein